MRPNECKGTRAKGHLTGGGRCWLLQEAAEAVCRAYRHFLGPVEKLLPKAPVSGSQCTEALRAEAAARAAACTFLETGTGVRADLEHTRRLLAQLPSPVSADRAAALAIAVAKAAGRGQPADLCRIPMPPRLAKAALAHPLKAPRVGDRPKKEGEGGADTSAASISGDLRDLSDAEVAAGAALVISLRAVRSGPPGAGQPMLYLEAEDPCLQPLSLQQEQ